MESYNTRDFYLVSYLFLLGNQIREARLVNRNTTEFSFRVNDKLKEEVDNFYSQNASVNPMSYGSSFRSVKSIVHSLKSGYVPSTSNPEALNNENNNKQRNFSRS